ncbi:hypothetical protein Pse7367_2969 [Thalassoporum mexicanum PCC 7367]|uniref:hypothetical protein n=1 Tax=Thalassoporum mexicanum TaxID=3457544 RepID=UPI00029FD2CD|nr:hypothetical protein [Pseudanabaena sp. PCC 7367]AFY71220.1 hypothetical protein Pse7367_2969 [Pseudanabaena sp. PCC 7367]
MSKTGTVRLAYELLERIDAALGEGQSRPDLITKAVEAYLAGACVPLDDQHNQHWFRSSKKLDQVKEALEITEDKVEMTEAALVNKAAEISGLSVEQITVEGRQYRAQDAITRSLSTENREGHTQGIVGAADERLDEAYEAVKGMVKDGTYKPKDGRISLTAISQRAMANYNSAKSWAERRGHTELLSSSSSAEPTDIADA